MNGIIIDGVLHELKPSKSMDCKKCSLYDLCNNDFGNQALCNIDLMSTSTDKLSPMFKCRGKVKITKEVNNE